MKRKEKFASESLKYYRIMWKERTFLVSDSSCPYCRPRSIARTITVRRRRLDRTPQIIAAIRHHLIETILQRRKKLAEPIFIFPWAFIWNFRLRFHQMPYLNRCIFDYLGVFLVFVKKNVSFWSQQHVQFLSSSDHYLFLWKLFLEVVKNKPWFFSTKTFAMLTWNKKTCFIPR